MRIVGGRFRGRALQAPVTRAIRPTSDRLRESVFNILAHGYDGMVENARVIDLFAGTGALGLEAVSRGARFALFVDDGAQARALLRENVEALGLGGLTRIFRRDATRLGAAPVGEKFDLAFLDPPYGHGFAPRALAALVDGGWLNAGALAIVEEAAGAEIELPAGMNLVERRAYGETQFVFARFGGRDG
ncbi:MAG: 16S rRNA (guanine(966)-N(2))-methyltransferase RsmD [Rhodoblastus sp.]